MSNPNDTKTMRSLIEAANMITNPTTLVRDTWLTEEEVEEAIAEATKRVGNGNQPMTGVPAGASKEDHEKARKANPFRVGLSKGVPAGAGAKPWSGKTTKLNKFANYAVVAADENGSALSWPNRTQAQNFSDRHNLNGVVEPSAMGRSFYVSVSDISEATWAEAVADPRHQFAVRNALETAGATYTAAHKAYAAAKAYATAAKSAAARSHATAAKAAAAAHTTVVELTAATALSALLSADCSESAARIVDADRNRAEVGHQLDAADAAYRSATKASNATEFGTAAEIVAAASKALDDAARSLESAVKVYSPPSKPTVRMK